jgi:hypothetical protein
LFAPEGAEAAKPIRRSIVVRGIDLLLYMRRLRLVRSAVSKFSNNVCASASEAGQGVYGRNLGSMTLK